MEFYICLKDYLLFIMYILSLNIILQNNNTQNLNKNESNLIEKIINLLDPIKQI